VIAGSRRTGVLTGRATWLAVLLFTGLTVLLAYPLSLHPSTLRFPSGPDGEIGWYLLGWDTHAFLHKPWAIFDANIYYPQRLTLAYGENVIGIALFVAPVIWLTGNLLLAANVASLLSCVLCGVGAYVLARRVGLSVAAAVICGIIFECAPPRFFRIGQINLSNVQWIPFGLAALHAYFDDGRKRDLRLAAACVTLQALSSGHGFVFMGVALLMFVLYRVMLGEPLLFVKRIRDLGVVGALLLLPPILVFLPYRAVQRDVGLRRGLGSWDANYSSFIASPSHLHRFLLSLVTTTDVNATALSYMFPGYIPIALAAVAIVLGGAALARDMTPWRAEVVQTRRRPEPFHWKPIARFKAIYARPLMWLLIALACWALTDAARRALPAGTGLPGQYYANAKWDGRPVMSVVDPQPSTTQLVERWNNEPPPTFSAAWNGYLSIARPGLYFFATTSDDRSRLYVDTRLVVDNTGGHATGQAGSIRLDRGPHRVVLEYVHVAGHPALKWEWVFEGDSDKAYKVVPRWALSQRPASAATVFTARIVEVMRGVATILVAFAVLWCLLAWPISRHDTWVHSLAPYRRNPTAFYFLLTAVCVWLAVGPPYGLWQFLYWLPGFNLIRGSSRFMVVGLLGIAVLAGIGFDKISGRLARLGRVVLAAVVGVLLVAEYAAIPMGVQPAKVEIPAIDRWLDTRPKPFVVAEVPVQSLENALAFERQETAYMLHSTAHWQKTVHGYSGWRTGLHMQLYAEMQFFPDETSVASLSDLGVTYIVVHSDSYPPGEWSRVEERLREFSSRLRLEHVDGAGRAYAVLRPAAGGVR
jgi:PA14 domain-containing protein